MTARFVDKVVLVTGGGSGIGREAALAFAREGATVVVAGRAPAPLAETVRLVEQVGSRASAVTADVARPDDAARIVAESVERHGGLHVAINNAGTFGVPGRIGEVDDDAWARLLATNLTGTFLTMKHEIAHMRSHGGGVIVNVASNVGAHLRVPGLGAYAASKAAVSTLTRAAAREYVRDGIRINAVSPGPVATSMSRLPGESDAERDARIGPLLPIGRVGRVEEIVAAILWLASPEAAFVVGHDLVIDGGASA